MTETVREPRLKKLWRVEIERTSTTYVLVLADTEQEARDDAEEMADRDEFDWNDDTYYFPRELSDTLQLHETEPIWTGGPDGEDITVKQFRENPPTSAESTKPPPEIPGQLSLEGDG